MFTKFIFLFTYICLLFDKSSGWLYSDGLFNCTAMYDFDVDYTEVDDSALPFIHKNDSSTLRKRWTTKKDANHYHSKLFQKWLLCRQFSDVFCGKGTIELVHDYGIGSSITNGALHLAIALLQQKVYRPTKHWLWADSDPLKCTLNMSSLDCYFQLLSSCGKNPLDAKLENEERASTLYCKSSLHVSKGTTLDGNSADTICALAQVWSKPIIWVYGQLIDYIIRPNSYLRDFIRHRSELVFNDTSSKHLMYATSPPPPHQTPVGHRNGAIIGIHIRGRSPDADRATLSLSHYMRAMDEKAAEIERRQREEQRNATRARKEAIAFGVTGGAAAEGAATEEVAVPGVVAVFICTDDVASTVVSEEHLNTLYPRKWRYVLLPRREVGGAKEEQETALRNMKQGTVDRQELLAEYMADMEILAKADAFIGCHSNVYGIVAALRLSRYSQHFPLNHTCLLDHRLPRISVDGEEDGPFVPLHCEGSKVARGFWSSQFMDLGMSPLNDGITYWSH
jgi:hypothetical protein